MRPRSPRFPDIEYRVMPGFSPGKHGSDIWEVPLPTTPLLVSVLGRHDWVLCGDHLGHDTALHSPAPATAHTQPCHWPGVCSLPAVLRCWISAVQQEEPCVLISVICWPGGWAAGAGAARRTADNEWDGGNRTEGDDSKNSNIPTFLSGLSLTQHRLSWAGLVRPR